MKQIALVGICLFLLSSQAFSETIYVTDHVKAMFRTGPGNDHKIIKTVSSGEKLTILESTEKWTRVQRSNGEEGWVLNQWLSIEMPKNIRLRILENKYEKLLKAHKKQKTVNREFEDENKTLKSNLAITKKNERDNKTAYDDLKNASANYLKLQGDYKKVKADLEKLTNETELLNDKLTQKHITWFLTGAGVLFLGIILGFNSRKQRRSSY